MLRPSHFAVVIALAATLAGCNTVRKDLSKGFFGVGGSDDAGLGNLEKRDLAAARTTTIGVNSYLWRASLDALAFMPLLQTDSNGGVIVTDWYANPQNPGERMKVTVTILDQDLRADALRVAASRQIAQGSSWVDAPVQAATVQKLEEIILTKARDLRQSGSAG